MTELKMTHVLLLAVAAFLMYHFIGDCNCNRGDGFRVGGQNAACKCSDEQYDIGSDIQYNAKDSQCEIPYAGGTIANWNASVCTGIHDKTKCNKTRTSTSWFKHDFHHMKACMWDDKYKPPCSYDNQKNCNNDKNCSWCMELNGDMQKCNTLDNAKNLVDSGVFECPDLPPSN